MSDLVSVIIPVYNTEKYLPKCIDSIVGQTHHNLEIVLSDDGAFDGSSEICDEYATFDDRIISIHQRNGGVSKARNAGLRLATGDYYQFPDSDDYIEIDSYEYLLNLIKRHHCDAVNFEYYSTYKDYEVAHRLNENQYGRFSQLDAHRIIFSGEPFACNKLYSRKLIAEQGDYPGVFFNEEIARGEDTLFANTAIERSENVWFDKRPLYHYQQTEQSACRGAFNKNQLTALKLYDAYRPIIEKHPQLKGKILSALANLHITLYCDMCFNGINLDNEKRFLIDSYRTHFPETMRFALPMKEKLKFVFFRITPNGFVWMHKMIHRL